MKPKIKPAVTPSQLAVASSSVKMVRFAATPSLGIVSNYTSILTIFDHNLSKIPTLMPTFCSLEAGFYKKNSHSLSWKVGIFQWEF